MITITKAFAINDGVAPYVVNVNSLAEAAVTFPSPSVVSIELNYETEDQILTTDSVTIIDANGCLATFPLGIENICDDFYVSSIMKSGTTYTVTSTEEGVIYNWSYNEKIFAGEENSNSIILTQIANGGITSPLTVEVINSAGCLETRTFTINLCNVFAEDKEEGFVRSGSNYIAQVLLTATSACEGTINWSTLEFFDSAGLVIEQPGNGPLINFTSTVLEADRIVRYRVRDVNNIISNIANINLSYSENFGSFIPDRTVSFAADENSIVIYLETLPAYIDINSLFVVNGLSTVPFVLNGSTLTVDMTGEDVGKIGIGGNDLNGITLIPGLLLLSRDLAAYSPTISEISTFCVNKDVDLAVENATITEVVSVDEPTITISGTTLTLTGELSTRVISVVVKNADGQTATKDINLCNLCQSADVSVSVCNTTVTPYDYLDTPLPNGVWTSQTGSPLPATYDGEVTLPTNSAYNWEYTTPNVVPESGFVCSSVQETLQITKIAATAVDNDECAAPTSLGVVAEGATLLSPSVMSATCDALTSWSGSTGNLSAANYDQWFDFTATTTTIGTLKLTVTVTGYGTVPLTIPKVQLWSGCATPLVGALSTTLNSATLVFQKSAAGIEDFLIQVLSDNSGQYVINTKVEVI